MLEDNCPDNLGPVNVGTAELPVVTIITPAYNRENLISETIESILGQDYPNLEYIVLDDGSSDGTLDVVKNYEGRLKWVSHPNMGEARTVNAGFDLATGSIIGVVNSDDPLLPGAVRRIVSVLLENPSAVVAYPDWLLIDERGETVQEVKCREFVSSADMVRGHHCLPGPGAFFKRIAVEKTSGRDPNFRFVGDMDFWFRIGLLGPFLRVPEVLATYRVHSESASVSCQNIGMAQEHISVVSKIFENTDLNVNYKDIRSEAIFNSYHAAVCYLGSSKRIKKISYICRSIAENPKLFLFKYPYRLIIYMFLLIGFDYKTLFYMTKKINMKLFKILKK